MAVRSIVEKIGSQVKRNLDKYIHQLKGAIYLSDEQKESYENHFHFPKDLLSTVIINPVYPSPLWDNPRPNNKHTIIAAGRLQHDKNFQMLINAFSLISSKYPDWILTIYGEGPYRKNLEELIRENDLASRIFLPGFVANIEEKYHEASFFVHPSKVETFGNVLAEAMCLGTPCIATDCYGGGGPKKLIRDGISGIIIDNEDEKALKAAMLRLIEDPIYAKSLGEKAKDLRITLSLQVIVNLWLEFFGRYSETFIVD